MGNKKSNWKCIEFMDIKANKWSEYNKELLSESKYHLSRGDAFINEDNN